jgi:hypothetical protein
MRDRRKKSKKAAEPHLPPLALEAEAQVQAQVDKVREALAAGQDLETVKPLVTPKPDDLPWDLHLIQSLAGIRHEAMPPLLAELFGSSPDKERKKAVKRALHWQKTRGVAVPEDVIPREESRPGAAAPSPALLAYVSPIFGNGERYVILEGPKELLRGNFLVARLSDTAGFQECHLLSLKRKHREEFWEHFREQGLGDFAAVPPAHAVRLLEEAYALNPDSDTGGQNYGSLRALIWQHWGRPEDAPELPSLLPAINESERGLYLERSRELARSEIFQSWLPSMEEVGPWVKKVQEVQESPLILAEHQQRARYDQIMEEAARAFYPPETRDLWRRRLLEMAYFLDLKGRAQEARAVQAAGEYLEAGGVSPLRGENPFLLGLVMYAVMLALEYLKQTEAKAPSGLVTPSGEPLIIRR